MNTSIETDVVIIGGGATGVGLAWDLVLRGIRVVLAEMGDLATGTSGRYHGLLHSGGRYAVKDVESAKECIDENTILRRIAPHVLEDTGGYFVLCPGDEEAYVNTWLAACQSVGIPTHEIPVGQARKVEPILNRELRRVFEVPDGSCDSWDLAHALQDGCLQYGAHFLTYHKVTAFHKQENKITGVRLVNLRDDTQLDISSAVVVLATGPWSAELAAQAGATLNMKLSRGAMLAFNMRWVNTVINKLRPPGDGDIFVPVGTVSVTGTTSVSTTDPADMRIEPWEIQRILSETEGIAPGISRARILRAWVGVRPLYDPGLADAGRGAARTFSVLDHEVRDGLGGLVTIVGGKLTTFRLMAEKTADLVCAKLNVEKPCLTATTTLPVLHGDKRSYHHLRGRLDAVEQGQLKGALICECELVTAPQIEAVLQSGSVVTLNDIRRDLRVGMGPCQGGFCAFRTAGLRHEFFRDTPAHTHALLAEFAERRFGGMKPLLWGHNLRQALFSEHIYQRVLGISDRQPAQILPALGELPTAQPVASGKRVVIVGAGLAGLLGALTAVQMGAEVELIAQGQGAFSLYPGWIEIGAVPDLAREQAHPYYLTQSALGTGLALLQQLKGFQVGPFNAVTALGRQRSVAYALGGTLAALGPKDEVLIVGFAGWRDFYPQLVADNLQAQGYQAHAIVLELPQAGRFDNWPVDLARMLDANPASLIQQLKPKLTGATVVGFPAVLGFKEETRQQITDALGLPIFEIPTLPPSIPGIRVYQALRQELLEHGVRFTVGTQATALAMQDQQVSGVNFQTVSGRQRTIYGDAVLVCTGGLFGGGLASDYEGRIGEPLADLAVGHVPPLGEWFTADFLAGEAQPIHHVGLLTDATLRPLTEQGDLFAPNLFVAGRQLAGYSPIAEGSTEGVDIATGVFAAQQALLHLTAKG